MMANEQRSEKRLIAEHGHFYYLVQARFAYFYKCQLLGRQDQHLRKGNQNY